MEKCRSHPAANQNTCIDGLTLHIFSTKQFAATGHKEKNLHLYGLICGRVENAPREGWIHGCPEDSRDPTSVTAVPVAAVKFTAVLRTAVTSQHPSRLSL